MQTQSTKQEQIYAGLKEQIMTLQLAPRRKLSENAIAGKAGVSRTIVRSAITRLSSEGLVMVQPQSGTFVTAISLNKVHQSVFACNTVLAAMIAQICSDGLDSEQEDKMRAAREQMKALTSNTKERMERDALLIETIADLCRRDFAADFLAQVSADLQRAMWLAYETFPASSYSYTMSAVESMDVIDRMLFDYIRNLDAVAAQMTLQNHYNSILLQTEQLAKWQEEYFSA